MIESQITNHGRMELKLKTNGKQMLAALEKAELT
jgi:hypothetical protein